MSRFRMQTSTSELRESCRDRPLVTPELHEPNDFYGHAYWLKKYCGLPGARALKVAVEHAVFLNDSHWDVDLRTRMPVFLCATELHAREHEQRTGRRAIAIGPLLCYVPGSTPTPPPAPDAHLVVFPAHCSHLVDADFDTDELISRIEVLRREYQQVSICLYWRDVERGLDRLFASRGYACVSAGHMFSRHFLPRLLGILQSASAVFTNEVGTHVLYAVLQDRPVWIVPQRIEYRDRVRGTDVTLDDPPGDPPSVARMRELFATRTASITPAQREFIADITGIANRKSAVDLRSILIEAETMYRRRTSKARKLLDVLSGVDKARRRWVARAQMACGRE